MRTKLEKPWTLASVQAAYNKAMKGQTFHGLKTLGYRDYLVKMGGSVQPTYVKDGKGVKG